MASTRAGAWRGGACSRAAACAALQHKSSNSSLRLRFQGRSSQALSAWRHATQGGAIRAAEAVPRERERRFYDLGLVALARHFRALQRRRARRRSLFMTSFSCRMQYRLRRKSGVIARLFYVTQESRVGVFTEPRQLCRANAAK